MELGSVEVSRGWLQWAMVFTWSHYLRIIEKVPKHQFVTLRDAPRGGVPLYGVFGKANFCGLKATKKPRA